ncbi:MAG: hypothetical protein D6715_14565 [Calditrichaeota bacterium]|nr:MAG: hypothetical protein D6715_14565 [Calditrichota bacterium]
MFNPATEKTNNIFQMPGVRPRKSPPGNHSFLQVVRAPAFATLPATPGRQGSETELIAAREKICIKRKQG